MQELFSRKGLTFWLENPTRRQSSCSCSLMYLTMSDTATETGIRLIAASLLNCSVTARCCCNVETIMSITAVSDRPMLNVKSKRFTKCESGRSRFLRDFSTKTKNDVYLEKREEIKIKFNYLYLLSICLYF